MTADIPDDPFFGDIPSPEASHQEQGMPARLSVKGSLSGSGKRAVDAKSDAIAGEDVRPSKNEIVRGMIERLSGPSRADLPRGPELTEHGKKYGAAMDMADQLELDRQVDAKYAAREKARKSKKPGNRRA